MTYVTSKILEPFYFSIIFIFPSERQEYSLAEIFDRKTYRRERSNLIDYRTFSKFSRISISRVSRKFELDNKIIFVGIKRIFKK